VRQQSRFIQKGGIQKGDRQEEAAQRKLVDGNAGVLAARGALCTVAFALVSAGCRNLNTGIHLFSQ
jgi:hypothetical protein